MSILRVKNFLELHVVGKGQIKVDVVEFGDGTKSVRIPTIKCYDRETTFRIELFQRSMDDIMLVAQIVDIIRRNTRTIVNIILSLESPMYMRYDRVMNDKKDDAFALKQFVKMVIATGVDHVQLTDPHSEVAKELFFMHGSGVGFVSITPQEDCVYETLRTFNEDFKSLDHYDIVLPDAGAAKKVLGYETFQCMKARDPNTGKLSKAGFDIDPNVLTKLLSSKKDRIIIVDDICENGGTFLGCHKMLRERGVIKPMDLYITHGVFPNVQAMSKFYGVFENIYIYNGTNAKYLDLVCHTEAKIHMVNAFVGADEPVFEDDLFKS
ncbi:putative ribose-phosphate pyrophosphokinase family protein [Acinetobacter phage vB_AbaM_B09_Aci02-2]|uniref:Putative ribose-phosphate pyrophosphokinase family protein n=1 Tax=Acinetobacter phage vB_AbaM_B09_Aci02-2 TaxID=2315467 RepID=A0A386KL78_9CAUD|nr:ribose-phosphate pyrophosphokinase [Acinetobacter phage vB_AbaM_B09_Aci02-2]AYD85709.1 putative ribose-phosphate pyrophosphokinase family protein [Acinetobacter phage vB_AbaM_B09_Aci02-2]